MIYLYLIINNIKNTHNWEISNTKKKGDHYEEPNFSNNNQLDVV